MGTRFHTWRKGNFVGQDQFGNKYYRDRKDERRWVIYNGVTEPSMIPPGWHGWMHHRTDVLPDEAGYEAHAWQKEHVGNATGTSAAYRPKGSMASPGERPSVSGDYEPWSPV